MSLNEVGNICDLNHDGAVDLKDWGLFSEKWKWEKVLLAADLDRDGSMGVRDAYIFVGNWLWKNDE